MCLNHQLGWRKIWNINNWQVPMKMLLPNLQVPLKKFLPNHSRTSPFSGQCSSYESPEQHYWSCFEMINFCAFACFNYHMVSFCGGREGRENCLTYNANTSAPLCWKGSEKFRWEKARWSDQWQHLQLNIFIGPRSDHSLRMSLTIWLTDDLLELISRPCCRLNELT